MNVFSLKFYEKVCKVDIASSKKQHSLYFPVCLSIMTECDNTNAFRELLLEIYSLLTTKVSLADRHIQINSEVFHLIFFISSLIKPVPGSTLNLKLSNFLKSKL